MAPKLKDTYPPFKETYRDRARFNGHIFLVRFTDGKSAEDIDGNLLKFDHGEAVRLTNGESIHSVINSRSGTYAPAPKAEPKPEAADPPAKPKGRPKRNG